MPFVGEHACRIREPRQFVRFRRNNETDPNTIIGFRSDNSSDVQSFRYPSERWTESRARKHCADKEGRFEAAIKKKKNGLRAIDDCPECDDSFETAAETSARGKCAEQLMGMWAIQPSVFTSMFEAIKSYGIPVIKQSEHEPDENQLQKQQDKEAFERVGDVAVFNVSGIILKRRTSFGSMFTEVSTLTLRRGIRNALADPDIESMVLMIDSPGGTSEGTHALLEDLARARQLMPVMAHIEDLGASAAWFIAAQAHKIIVSKGALVGSLGTFGHVVDSSGRAKMEGMTHHIIKAGKHKGDFQPGMPITESQLAEFQREVDDINEIFLKTSADGRGITLKQMQSLADGRIHVGEKAVAIGLADSIGSLEDAIKLAKETAMSDQEKATTFEAENPEIVKQWRDDAAKQAVEEAGSKSYEQGLTEGKKAGGDDVKAAEHARLEAIVKAVGPGREALAIEQFKAGNDAIQAKGALADTLGKENAELREKNASGSDGADAVGFVADPDDDDDGAAAEPKDPEKISDSKERAAAEWKQLDDEERARWTSEENYIIARSAEFDGRLKVSSSNRRRG